MARKSFPDSDLSASDMVGRQDSVAGAARKLEPLSGFVDDDTGRIVCGACSPNKANIVAQQCKDEVYPVAWFKRLKEELAAYDFLTHLRDQHRVFEVVIERVAGAYPLDQKPGAGIEQCRKFCFSVAIIMPIGIGQFPAQCFCR